LEIAPGAKWNRQAPWCGGITSPNDGPKLSAGVSDTAKAAGEMMRGGANMRGRVRVARLEEC
jgi:hypothetical protein